MQLDGADHETRRLEMLRSLQVVDAEPMPSLQDAAQLAAAVVGTEISLVTLLTEDRQCFAAKVGIDGRETKRGDSFCTHAILTPTDVMWVEDALDDPRFAENPLVVGPPHIRFYAGAPLVVNGFALGALCVISPEPRIRDEAKMAQLRLLAQIVSASLAERHRLIAVYGSLEASADALINCDEFGMITDWSAGGERLFGYTPDEAIGRSTAIIVPEREKAAHTAGVDRWREGGQARLGSRLELTAQRKDGSSIDIELWMSVWHDQGRRRIHANIRDITERNAQRAAIVEARATAEAASVAKTQFLANMSHELRTPLNGVIGVAGLLGATPLSEKQSEFVSIIQNSSNQLRVLIADLLDVARIEAGEVSIVPSEFDLETEVRAAFQTCRLEADAKGLVYESEASEPLGRVRGDSVRMKQVLTNLLANAIKFTEAGRVGLQIRKEASGVRFEVSDQGIGFTDDQRSVIFDRFQQADSTITRRFGGTGLGLSIARDLVQLMGGRIDCASTPGVGSRFWFTLPLSPVLSPAADADEDTPETEVLHVLIVDDNATNRRVAELMLSTLGATSVSAENGRDAFEVFTLGRFDLVLMDMMMPVMDGLDATRAIRAYEAERGLNATPIIMLTANSLPEHVTASLVAGANSHLSKPVTAASLLAVIDDVLTSSAEPTLEDSQLFAIGSQHLL